MEAWPDNGKPKVEVLMHQAFYFVVMQYSWFVICTEEKDFVFYSTDWGVGHSNRVRTKKSEISTA